MNDYQKHGHYEQGAPAYAPVQGEEVEHKGLFIQPSCTVAPASGRYVPMVGISREAEKVGRVHFGNVEWPPKGYDDVTEGLRLALDKGKALIDAGTFA